MSFGQIRKINDGNNTYDASAIPLEMLRNMASRKALPITVGGTSNRTFTLNASVTDPANLWIGDDFLHMTATLAYSWVVGTNVILHATTGAETTLTNGTAGIWYMYAGYNAAGTLVVYPSAAVPSAVQAPNGNGFLTHPGTAKTSTWLYVGFMLCDATTPTFVAMTKRGFTYETTDITLATTASLAVLAFTGAKALPAHDGVTVGGHLETGSAGTVVVQTGSVADTGGFKVSANAGVDMVPFGPLETNSAGKFYAIDTVARGDVHVMWIKDVI